MLRVCKATAIASVPLILLGAWFRLGLWGMLLESNIVPAYPYKIALFLLFPAALIAASFCLAVIVLAAKASTVVKLTATAVPVATFLFATMLFFSSLLTMQNSLVVTPVKKVLVDPHDPGSYIAQTVSRGGDQVFLGHSLVHWHRWGLLKLERVHLDSVTGDWLVIGPDRAPAGRIFIDDDYSRRSRPADTIAFGPLPSSRDYFLDRRTWIRSAGNAEGQAMLQQCGDTLGAVTLAYKTHLEEPQYDLIYHTPKIARTWLISRVVDHPSHIDFVADNGDTISVTHLGAGGLVRWVLPLDNGIFHAVPSELSWFYPWEQLACTDYEEGDVLEKNPAPPPAIMGIDDIWRYLDNIMYHSYGHDRYYRGYYSIGMAVLKLFPLKKFIDTYGLSVFRKGPHRGGRLDLDNKRSFGHYDPAFIEWASRTIIPPPGSERQRRYQPAYDRYLKSLARGFLVARKKLNAHPECRDSLVTNIRRRMRNPVNETFYFDNVDLYDFLGERYCGTAYPTPEDLNKNHLIGIVGFWLRRELDKTAGAFETALVRMLTTFDASFMAVHGGFVDELWSKDNDSSDALVLRDQAVLLLVNSPGMLEGLSEQERAGVPATTSYYHTRAREYFSGRSVPVHFNPAQSHVLFVRDNGLSLRMPLDSVSGNMIAWNARSQPLVCESSDYASLAAQYMSR